MEADGYSETSVTNRIHAIIRAGIICSKCVEIHTLKLIPIVSDYNNQTSTVTTEKLQGTFHFALDRLQAETSADVTVKVKVTL